MGQPDEDVLCFIRKWHNFWYNNTKIGKCITVVCFCFFTILQIVGFRLLFTTRVLEFWQKYCSGQFGTLYISVGYISLLTTNSHYNEIVARVWPRFWSIHAAGIKLETQIKREAMIVKLFMALLFFLTFLIFLFFLPWSGPEIYETYLPIPFILRSIDPKLGIFIQIMVYITGINFALVVLSIPFGLIYLSINLKFQTNLLNRCLKLMARERHTEKEMVDQKSVKLSLVKCIKLHQLIMELSNDINEMIYYSSFGFTLSGVVIGVCLISTGKTSGFSGQYLYIFKALVWTSFVLLIALSFVVCGQLIENESELIHTSITNLPWFNYNKENAQLLMIFAINSLKVLQLSSSGIVVINNELIIRMYRAVWSMMTFIWEMKKRNVLASVN